MSSETSGKEVNEQVLVWAEFDIAKVNDKVDGKSQT